jgi:hypothetical protein
MKRVPEQQSPRSLADPTAPFDATLTGDAPLASAQWRPSDARPAPRYVVENELARGGLGRILKAHDELLDRPVAIKEPLINRGNATHQRFQREAAITARLQHPAILPVYDAGNRANGRPYYVMKLLSDSRTLKEVVESGLCARHSRYPTWIALRRTSWSARPRALPGHPPRLPIRSSLSVTLSGTGS